MAFELIPMTRDHVLDVFPRRRGEARQFTLHDTLMLTMHAQQNGVAYTAIDGDLVIAIGGVYLSHPGVGNTWIVGTDDIKGHSKDFTIAMRKVIPVVMKEMQLHRIQADVITSRPDWIKWTKYLGFKEEGILRKFRGEEDAMVLSIIEEDL